MLVGIGYYGLKICKNYKMFPNLSYTNTSINNNILYIEITDAIFYIYASTLLCF